METDVTKLKIGQIWSYLYLAISEDTINIDMVLIHYLDDKRQEEIAPQLI
jgi:transposase-like protein